jgi:hypothetical protein
MRRRATSRVVMPRFLPGLIVVPIVVAVSLMTACTPPWRQAYLRGEDAVARGRAADAAVAFGESCDLDDAASDACVRARTLRRQAVEDALVASKSACTRDLGPCLDALEAARPLGAQERELGARLEAVLDDASARHVTRCEALASGTYQEAMIKARCLALRENDVGTGAHHQRVGAALARLADALDLPPSSSSSSSSSSKTPALQAIHAGLALCYAPTSARAAVANAARDAVTAHHAAAVDVTLVSGLRAEVQGSLCRAMAKRAPVRCERRPGALQVRAAVTAGDVEHTTRRTQKAVRYVDHVEEKPNPEYARLRDIVDQSTASIRQAAIERDDRKADCDTAESQLRIAEYCYDCGERVHRDDVCARARDADSRHGDLERAHWSKENDLRRTDAVLRIEHTAVFDYVEVRHAWTQPFRIEGRCSLGAFQEPALDANRTVRFEDDEHVGFGPAGLPNDPVTEPSGAAFASEVHDTGASEVGAYVDRCLTSFGADATHCDSDFDCFVRRALYRGEDPLNAAMGAFADAVDQARPDLPRVPCRQELQRTAR